MVMKGNFLRIRKALLPWPKPRGGPHLSVCHFCDTLHEALALAEGTAARCRCCGVVLYQNRPASLVRATAFSATSLILMCLMHWFPFLVMDAASVRTTLNLSSASMALYQQGNPILAVLLALFTIIVPISLAGGLIYVCGPLLFGRVAPGGMFVAKWLSRMEPWNMIEVFLLGVLVSLMKLGKVADVHFGIGFWAFGLLMISMAAAVAGIDRDELWDRLEVAKS